MFGWAFENHLLVKSLLVVDLIEIELLKKNYSCLAGNYKRTFIAVDRLVVNYQKVY